MKASLIVRAFAMAAVAGALSIGTAMLPARAAPVSPDNSPPPCESAALCIWQVNNFKGTEVTFPTADYRGTWYYLPDHGLTLPWGSFYDNSGSSVVFGDASTGLTKCYDKAKYPDGVPNPSVNHYGYFHIEYGVTDCTGTVPKLP